MRALAVGVVAMAVGVATAVQALPHQPHSPHSPQASHGTPPPPRHNPTAQSLGCCDLGSGTCDAITAPDCAVQGGQFDKRAACDFRTGSCFLARHAPHKLHAVHEHPTHQPASASCPTPDKQDGCAADEVCNANLQCQKLSDFCTDPTPPRNTPPGVNQCLHQGDAAVCVQPNLNAGAPCCPPGPGGGCDAKRAGDGAGTCEQVRRGGWAAINAKEAGSLGTLGSFPFQNSTRIFLSNNHVFARASGNFPPAGGNAAAGEDINQPSTGPVAGKLTDYEFLCYSNTLVCRAGDPKKISQSCTTNASCDGPAPTTGNGVCGDFVCTAGDPAKINRACTADGNCDGPAPKAGNGVCGDCAAKGGRNQLNTIGNNCIDAAIAGNNGPPPIRDILDVGTPPVFLPSICTAGDPAKLNMPCAAAANCDGPVPTVGNGKCGAPAGDCATTLSSGLLGTIVKKSGARTGLTCGMVTDVGVPNMTRYDPGTARFINQFKIEPLPSFTFNAAGGALGGNFTCDGDSGALVVGVATNRPVGLHFSGLAPEDCSRHCAGTETVCAADDACTAAVCEAKYCRSNDRRGCTVDGDCGTFCTAGDPAKLNRACTAPADCAGPPPMAGNGACTPIGGDCTDPSSTSSPIDLVLRRFGLHF